MAHFIDLVRIGWNKPPHVIAKWLLRKLKARRAAKVLPGWQRWLGASSMAAALDHESFDELVATLKKANPFPALTQPAQIRNTISDAAQTEIFARAEKAMRLDIEMLGSGPVQLSRPVDWTLDFKSNINWSMQPSLRLPVNDLKRPSDIKVPWELSRLQWLLPVGQAYVLNEDEKYATFAKEIIHEWMIANPVCRGPNWVCAMDVALRGISLVWLFQACKSSDVWAQPEFLENLIKQLILHAKFIDSNLEYADVNGNHLTADLAGLTVLGTAMGGAGISKRWVERSWGLLKDELPKQVLSDGVCFEASLPYHRLVAELFLLPVLARQNVGLNVDDAYLKKLKLMGVFTAAATRPDGTVPVWGDADDGRALPLGTQAINDHQYLAETLKTMNSPLKAPCYDETLWWLGVGNNTEPLADEPISSSFDDAGVFVMRDGSNHIFADVGPVGMDGRGGHGHNDCLSFCATLEDVPLIIDPGAYVYTADWQARNHFRGTAAHNTPQIDGEEINRFVRPEYLWVLRNDAVPEVRQWSASEDTDLLVGAHSGYQRLQSPVTPIRTIMLKKTTNSLFITDVFEGTAEHTVRIPYTFAPGIEIDPVSSGVWRISNQASSFLAISSTPDTWSGTIEAASYSPSYGVVEDVVSLVFERTGILSPIVFSITPEKNALRDPVNWLDSIVADRMPVPVFNT